MKTYKIKRIFKNLFYTARRKNDFEFRVWEQ